ncbi:hypothetical protein BCV72DRAFT_215184, partial [Rhizopus microsporus var. microsporus]
IENAPIHKPETIVEEMRALGETKTHVRRSPLMIDRDNLAARVRKAAEMSLPKIVKDELGILSRF